MTTTKAQPLKSKTFRVWLYCGRILQVVLALVVLGLDISVVGEWNQNQLTFNSVIGTAAGSLNIKTWVGGTPYTGIVLFTVSHPVRRT